MNKPRGTENEHFGFERKSPCKWQYISFGACLRGGSGKQKSQGNGHFGGAEKIAGCMACEYCHTKGNGDCIQKDDMQEVYEALKTTDLLVFASPVYYWSWSGQLQSVVSRFYPMGPVKVKKCALFLSSAGADVYDAPISQYRSMLNYFGAEDVGIYTCHGEENKSEKTLAKVRDFGASL